MTALSNVLRMGRTTVLHNRCRHTRYNAYSVHCILNNAYRSSVRVYPNRPRNPVIVVDPDIQSKLVVEIGVEEHVIRYR